MGRREGGKRGGVRGRMDTEIWPWPVMSLRRHSSGCPCPPDFNLGPRGDWQRRRGPSANPALHFQHFISQSPHPAVKEKSSDPSLSSIPSPSGLIMSWWRGKKTLSPPLPHPSSKGKHCRTSVSLRRLRMSLFFFFFEFFESLQETGSLGWTDRGRQTLTQTHTHIHARTCSLRRFSKGYG